MLISFLSPYLPVFVDILMQSVVVATMDKRLRSFHVKGKQRWSHDMPCGMRCLHTQSDVPDLMPMWMERAESEW